MSVVDILPPSSRTFGRVLGESHSDRPGPTLVVVGSIHGNEPAGRLALQSVVARLETLGGVTRGDFVALVGNVQASVAETRFVDVDLNRCWDETSRRTLEGAGEAIAEAEELRELLSQLSRCFDQARGDVYLIDLHTTSGAGRPFCVFADSLRIRRFARRFPVPLILGFEEELRGTLIDHVAQLGHVAIAIEGGQHDEPGSVTRLEAAVWIAMQELGLATESQEADTVDLGRAALGIPRALEVRYRHAITPEDDFEMLPGFSSFDRIARDQVLARARGGDVRAPMDGFLLMPLYQKLGEDGFFIAEGVWRFWLSLSSLLRRLHVGAIAHWLPGVSRAPSGDGVPERLEVDMTIARWYALEILHLLGFRRLSRAGDTLVVQRRSYDLRGSGRSDALRR